MIGAARSSGEVAARFEFATLKVVTYAPTCIGDFAFCSIRLGVLQTLSL